MCICCKMVTKCFVVHIKLDDGFKTSILKAHNEYRAKHGAPALEWSETLERNAKKWADELCRRQRLQHASLKNEGENLAFARGKRSHCG